MLSQLKVRHFGFEERVRIGDTHRWRAGESSVG